LINPETSKTGCARAGGLKICRKIESISTGHPNIGDQQSDHRVVAVKEDVAWCFTIMADEHGGEISWATLAGP